MMNFTNILDLNLPPSEEEIFIHVNDDTPIHVNLEGSKNHHAFDLNTAFEDSMEYLDEEIMHEDQRESTNNMDLNQFLQTDCEEDDSPDRQVSKKKELSNEERRQIYLALLARSANGKLRRGTFKDVSQLFSVTARTISRIWEQAKKSSAHNNGKVDVNHQKTRNCGRKRIEIDPEKFRKIPLSKRTSIRSTACSIEVSKSALHRSFQSGTTIRRHSNPVKPLLKDSNKKTRVQFCLSMIDKNSGDNPRFLDMFNTIHIDEKWFYITKKCEKYYLLLEECDPERTCKSKNFLTKVMFLAAMARPRYDSDGNEIFSGKIGIFPFITEEPAKRSSVNRVAGTLETKAITSVGKDLSRSYLINKVLPAILEKWPFGDENTTIVIQQDNARTHINPNDEEFRLAVAKYGLNIELRCQPPNSPDLNILDLGFFNAIQTLQHKEAPKTVIELVIAVQKAFDTYPSEKVNHIFLTLQECMLEIMKVRGSNNYKIPHMNKDSLERSGNLPLQLQCDAKLVEDATNWLNTC